MNEHLKGDYQYSALNHGNRIQRFWHAKKLEKISHNVPDGLIVLDAGCGSGNASFYLCRKSKKVIGIDSNYEAVRFCRVLSKKRGIKNVQFVYCEIKKISLKDSSVDVIVCSEVIEHVPLDYMLDALREFHRVLKHDGILIITTPDYSSLYPLIEKVSDSLRITAPIECQHVEHYNCMRLMNTLDFAGYLEHIETFMSVPSLFAQFVSWDWALSRKERRGNLILSVTRIMK
jgi:ubiquinone/menaquinone biosynthesis C-methylase UbiE